MVGRKKSINELIWAGIAIVISLLAVFWVYRLWNKDLTVPIFYYGDGGGAIVTIQRIIESDYFYCSRFAAPFGEYAGMQGELLQLFVVKLISIFTKDVGIVANAYWLLTYVLTAVTAYAVLRKVNICPQIAAVGAIIYNFLPSHYFRLQHIWLASIFIFPLVVWILVDLMDEGIWTQNGVKQLLKSRKVWLDIVLCLLVSASGIYYAVFTVILFAIVAFLEFISEKKAVYLGILLSGVIVLMSVPIFVSVILPQLVGMESFMESVAEARTVGSMEHYGLRIFLLFFPIAGHRLSVLSNFTQQYFDELNVYTENYMVQLGLMMSIGFICSMLAVFCKKFLNEKQDLLQKMGKLNLIAVLVATVGGIEILIGIFLSSSIRCYNRYSVYIAIFSLVAFCLLLQFIFEKLHNKVAMYIILSLIGVVAVLDQTSDEFGNYLKYNVKDRVYEYTYDEISEKYKGVETFIAEVEAELEPDSNLYLMPANENYRSESGNILKKEIAIATKTSNTTYSYWGVSQAYTNWLAELEKTDMSNFLNALSILDMSGVIIEKNAYAEEADFYSSCKKLEKLSGAKPKIYEYEDDLLYYYNIEAYRDTVLAEYSKEEIEEFRNTIWQMVNVSYERVSLEKFSGGTYDKAEATLTVKQGETQYGPYIDLDKGTYQITILGENLEQANVWATANNGEGNLEVEGRSLKDTAVSYRFKLEEYTEGIELLLCNDSGDSVIEGYFITEVESGEMIDIAGIEEKKKELSSLVNVDYTFGKINLSEFWKDDALISTTSTKVVLGKEDLIYGPYYNLEAGRYRITFIGDNLSEAEFRATALGGESVMECDYLVKEDDCVSYEFKLEKSSSLIEFIVENRTNEKITVKQCFIESTKEGFLPEFNLQFMEENIE